MSNNTINTLYIVFEFLTFALTQYLFDTWWISVIAVLVAPIIVGIINGRYRAIWDSIFPSQSGSQNPFEESIASFGRKKKSMYPSLFYNWFFILIIYWYLGH